MEQGCWWISPAPLKVCAFSLKMQLCVKHKVPPIDEWISFFEKIIAETKKTGKAPEWLTRIFTALFLSLDLDGDRKIRVDEYGLYLKSIRVGEDPEKVFNLVDSDGNGIIDLDELEDIASQWVLSDNPDDPGNYFLMGTV